MAQKSHGKRAGTRRKLKKDEKSRSTLSGQIKELKAGEKVTIKIDPSVQDGMPHPKYQGKDSEIKGKQGRSYKVEIKDKGKKKILISHPAHLRRK